MSSLKKLRKEYIERASELFPGVTPFIPVINREIFKRYGIVCKGKHTKEFTTWKYEHPDGTVVAAIETSTSNMSNRNKEIYEFYISVLNGLRDRPLQKGLELDENHYLVDSFLVSKDLYLKSNKWDIVAQPNSRVVILKYNDNCAKVVEINLNGLFLSKRVRVQVAYK